MPASKRAHDHGGLRFPLVTLHSPEGMQRCHRITCCECGKHHDISTRSFPSGLIGTELIARKARGKGWTIGPRVGRDWCDECSRATHRQLTVRTEVKGSDMPPKEATAAAPVVAAEPPREMDMDDAITITLRLQDVYEKGKGYCQGYTDKVVAKDLGCPRAWVTVIRRKHFGEDGGNEEIDAARQEVNAALARYAEIAREISQTIEANQAISRTLGRLRDEVQQQTTAMMARLDRIEKLVR